ncbi:hypothetical protein PPACK8108_LOCUS25539, partial [Phakopsora pachyrhizi]
CPYPILILILSLNPLGGVYYTYVYNKALMLLSSATTYYSSFILYYYGSF